MNTIPATAPSTTPTMAANRESVNATASKPPKVEPSTITTKATILLVLNDTSSLLTFALCVSKCTEKHKARSRGWLLRGGGYAEPRCGYDPFSYLVDQRGEREVRTGCALLSARCSGGAARPGSGGLALPLGPALALG